ncbi:DUF58 domain-containing protein [Candidatus Phycosocius spiralis]|uniref:DUF58 domain-containing protein n=1 Tax=Candidatus Phycosocius spiralis TaxID=2815099 RepID=A0ABQ4PVI3_9PROT|nr:DUF58 domain-containing protein [Candidatus Phycosocius spiralis]GIU66894.1 hypothetical protein PsB1_1048 [Candidatus Phycosocius spiralis]
MMARSPDSRSTKARSKTQGSHSLEGNSSSLSYQARELQKGLPAVLMDARKAAKSLFFGTHGRKSAGIGEAFWQHRELADGEALHQIDWRRSARSDRLFVREMEREGPALLQIWADTRPSMCWRGDETRPMKAERGLVLAMAIALAVRAGGERVLCLRGGKAMTQEDAFGAALIKSGQQDWVSHDVAPAQHGHILLISDGLECEELWSARLKKLAPAQGRLILVIIQDRDEIEFPFEGRVAFSAFAQQNPILIANAQSVQVAYRDRYERHLAQLRGLVAQANGQFLTHATDQAVTPVALQIAAILARGAI